MLDLTVRPTLIGLKFEHTAPKGMRLILNGPLIGPHYNNDVSPMEFPCMCVIGDLDSKITIIRKKNHGFTHYQSDSAPKVQNLA